MPLVDLDLQIAGDPLPTEIDSFLREANRRIDEFQQSSRVPGFVASEFASVYRVLAALSEIDLAPGKLFCEWGSGFGVVACLAAFLDFDACGIEIDADLVQGARELARDFDLPVEFACGSFLPRNAEQTVQKAGEFSWLTTEGNCGYQELGLSPDDFGVIFAYPWPDEESLTANLFDFYAAGGAVLATFHGGDDVRVRQKRSKRRRS